MTGKTHIIGGLDVALAAPLLSTTIGTLVVSMGYSEYALCLFAAVVGSLFPDIDLHHSKIGHKAGAVSWLIHYIFGHRTLFHSPLLMVIIYFVMAALFREYQVYIIFFLIGMGSHLLLDMCNKKGIPLLYPFPKRFHIMGVKTRSMSESITFVILLVIFLVLLICYYVLR